MQTCVLCTIHAASPLIPCMDASARVRSRAYSRSRSWTRSKYTNTHVCRDLYAWRFVWSKPIFIFASRTYSTTITCFFVWRKFQWPFAFQFYFSQAHFNWLRCTLIMIRRHNRINKWTYKIDPLTTGAKNKHSFMNITANFEKHAPELSG